MFYLVYFNSKIYLYIHFFDYNVYLTFYNLIIFYNYNEGFFKDVEVNF